MVLLELCGDVHNDPRVPLHLKRASTSGLRQPVSCSPICLDGSLHVNPGNVGRTGAGSTTTAKKSLSPWENLFRQNKSRKLRQRFTSGKRKWRPFSRKRQPSKAQGIGGVGWHRPFFSYFCFSWLCRDAPPPRAYATHFGEKLK